MKVLIYFNKNVLSPCGGPSGYLLNVYNQVQLHNDKDIYFLDENVKKSKKNKTLRKIISPFSSVLFIKYIFNKHNNIKPTDFNNYDIIHFHRPIDLFIQEKNLANYKGIVILTSHSPKVYYKELIEDAASKFELLFFKKIFSKMELVDRIAFSKADYILFPCKEAEEPYFNSWKQYKDIRIEYKMLYCPTGIDNVPVKVSRKDIRNMYNVGEDKILISFVGRHNEVKGYDVLKKLGEVLDKDKYTIICCGNESPLKGLDKENWIEVGWTNDPYSIVNASDIYVLPNKQTYFDIAMLQTLSIGKVSIISNTGGNKYFKNQEKNGIYLYNTFEQFVELINMISCQSIEERINIEDKQREFFKNNFTSEIYYKNYKLILNEILEKERNNK